MISLNTNFTQNNFSLTPKIERKSFIIQKNSPIVEIGLRALALIKALFLAFLKIILFPIYPIDTDRYKLTNTWLENKKNLIFMAVSISILGIYYFGSKFSHPSNQEVISNIKINNLQMITGVFGLFLFLIYRPTRLFIRCTINHRRINTILEQFNCLKNHTIYQKPPISLSMGQALKDFLLIYSEKKWKNIPDLYNCFSIYIEYQEKHLKVYDDEVASSAT